MATGGQRWMLKEHCGVGWKKSAKMTDAEATGKIVAAKLNAAEAWRRGIRQAASLTELRTIGEAINRRKNSDKLISGTRTLVDLRAVYQAKFTELKGGGE
jgi:hypothetical protein